MSLLGTLLPGILGAINPANILKGIVGTATGVLENVSQGKPVDVSGNLARGLKVAIGEPQSSLGSIGGNNLMEPNLQQQLSGEKNAANVFNIKRTNDITRNLQKSIKSNVANHTGVYNEDRTRSQQYASLYPTSGMISVGKSVESAPAGLPINRIAIGHADGLLRKQRVPKTDLLNVRDENGYKTIPIKVSGVRTPNFNITETKKKGRKKKKKD